jgi:thiosulfate/3-mercaptopyruvate sulfurtransferase
VVLVDVRGSSEYTSGHIPGAVNLEWSSTNLNADGTFKSVSELKALYEAKGVTPDIEIITYCVTGTRAANTWFVLKYVLGYPNVKNYEGSWDEWSAKGYPTE